MDLIINSLKTLSSLCVSLSYTICEKNQNQAVKLNGLSIILELCTNEEYEQKLKCEAYYCLSMICFRNKSVSQEFFNLIEEDEFIKNIMNILFVRDSDQMFDNYRKLQLEQKQQKNDSNSFEKLVEIIDTINCKLKIGLTICSFMYHDEEFYKKIARLFGGLDWNLFKNIIYVLNTELNQSINEKNERRYFNIQKMRCQLAYIITIMHELFVNAEEDTRATGIKMMIDIIPFSTNTCLRSVNK